MGASESKGREENGENKESSDTAPAKESSSTAALAAGAFAGAAILALGASVVIMMGELSEPSEEEKTMKAPGRDMRIPRRAFEGNPKGYFKNLRSDLRKK
ncbi:hypothetical protein BT93_L4538 [Corymbia citriodora subsp. variegata]|uniref:Uncharacterized protein n=1 Tax=Corymbia citriodora subsp. variegata TaxID=360336 RepID=A0A8T0CU51_CORYI|nr:hypothetical protein BT93_L4538 [Corymbia citriodora subsp. variegata]